jgi:hypothetical protein
MWFLNLLKPPPVGDPNEPRWKYSILGLLVILLFIGIALFIYTGTFSRFQADDYCSSRLLREEGYLGAQIKSYTTWSNRYSTMLVTGVVDLFDVIGIRFLPGILIAGLFFSIHLLLKRTLLLAGRNINRIILIGLTSIITFFSIYTAPNQFQSFFWRSGNITYTLPVICLFFLLAVLIDRKSDDDHIWKKILVGIFSFFAAGFSETNAAMQTIVIGTGILVGWWFEKKSGVKNSRRSWWMAAMVGTLAGLLVIAISPGNATRMQQMPNPPGLFEWILLSLRYSLGFVYNSIAGYVLPVVIIILLSFSLAIQTQWQDVKIAHQFRLICAILVFVYFVIVACCAPSAYAQSAYPEDRALTGAKIIFTWGVVSTGYLLGIIFQSWRSKLTGFKIKMHQANGAFIILLICVYIIYAILNVLVEIPDYLNRAAAWDARAEQISAYRQVGEMNPTVNALDSYGRIREISDNPDLWVNRCAAAYYQVDSITAK